MNEENFNRHVNNCHYRNRAKKGIRSYFSKRQGGNIAGSATRSSLDISNEDDVVVVDTPGENPIIPESENDDVTIPAEGREFVNAEPSLPEVTIRSAEKNVVATYA